MSYMKHTHVFGKMDASEYLFNFANEDRDKQEMMGHWAMTNLPNLLTRADTFIISERTMNRVVRKVWCDGK